MMNTMHYTKEQKLSVLKHFKLEASGNPRNVLALGNMREMVDRMMDGEYDTELVRLSVEVDRMIDEQLDRIEHRKNV